MTDLRQTLETSLGHEYSIEGALESFTQRKGITVGIASR